MSEPGVKRLAQDGVARTRAAYEQFVGASERAYNALEDASATSLAAFREFGLRVFAMTDVNVKAMLDAAEGMAAARDPGELAALQSRYLFDQAQRTSEQLVELNEIAARFSRDIAPRTGS